MTQSPINGLGVIWHLLQEIVPVVSPLITAILTGFLVYLYRRQSKILERQRLLSESEQRALPRVLTYRLFSWRKVFQYEQQTKPLPDIPEYPDRYAMFFAYLSNPGKGYAEDLHIELRIDTQSYNFSKTLPLVNMTNTDQLLFNDQEGGVIAPEENETTLYTTAFWFTESDVPEQLGESDVTFDSEITPSELLWILEDMGESPVEIGLFLHYVDGTGIQEPIQLLTSKSELDSYDDITEKWRGGSVPSGDMEPLFSFEDSE